MRIAVDISAASNPEGSGVSSYVRELARNLPDFSEPGDEFFFVSRPGRTSGLAKCGFTRSEKIKTGLISFPFDLLFKNKIDIFHGPDARLPYYKCALVATINDLFSLVSEDFAEKKFRDKKTARYKDIADRADFIIVPSENTRRDVIERLGVSAGRIVIIPLAAGLEICPIPRDEIKAALGKFDIKDRYVLFTGDVSARKNLARLIRAFGAAREKIGNDSALLIVGKDAFGSHEARAEAAKLPEGAVKFTGYVSRDELRILYSGAAVFAFPSLYEGFGMPVLEAFSAGIPVAASNRSSIPEVAGDAAVLFDPESEEAISDALARVFSDEALRSALVEKGNRQLEKFSWKECAAETLSVYRAAVKNRRERKMK